MLNNIEQRFAQETVQTFNDSDVIFSEGDETHEMFIVQQGEVVIAKKTNHGDVILATLKRGDFFGEMSLLESLPRSATARAKGETKLLTILPGGFLLKIRRDPTFAFEMLQSLSKRIRLTNDRLVTAIQDGKSNQETLRSILNKTEYITAQNENS
jgi:CRP/FNR family cyclic AMP-dependent transcriptional regulator